MADWSTEAPAGQWMPCDVQLANWSTEPAVYAIGIPTMEYASTDMFGSICYQTSISICDEEEQSGYNVATRCDRNEVVKQESEVEIHQNTVFKDVADDSERDFLNPQPKMYRYPASIEALCLDERYTTPMVVAIGPYYHNCEHLKRQAEKMKYVAASQCFNDQSRYTRVKHMYQHFAEVARGVGGFYDRDAVAGICCDDFLHMMFFDACFLVQYMYIKSDYPNRAGQMNQSLVAFFDTNSNEIFHDIMLLQNQIPWCVVQTIFKEIDGFQLNSFIRYFKGCLSDVKHRDTEKEPHELYNYHKEPPHLLALLRYHIVGRSQNLRKVEFGEDQISLSVGANELAEMGISLTPNEDTELIHMRFEKNCIFYGQLFLAPVSLDDTRVSCLLNMAAHELCTTPNFQGAKEEDSAVCSYVLLLAMLVAREEDVHKLRTQHVLHGGGLANKDVLDFFTKLHSLRLGTSYVHIMQQIENYQSHRWKKITCYRFVCRNIKFILKFVTLLAGIAAVISAIAEFSKK